jgi:hypothetical protein
VVHSAAGSVHFTVYASESVGWGGGSAHDRSVCVDDGQTRAGGDGSNGELLGGAHGDGDGVECSLRVFCGLHFDMIDRYSAQVKLGAAGRIVVDAARYYFEVSC